jgi:hypothetical protein
MNTNAMEELIRLEEAWNLGYGPNDAEGIGPFMADDWTITGPDGTLSDKPTFLGSVKSGALTHDVMECDDVKVRIYGDTTWPIWA